MDVYDLVKPDMHVFTVFDLVQELLDKGENEMAFSIAEGLYWFCNDWHPGQSSDLYLTQCRLHFKPSPMARGPEDEDAKYVYNTLAETCRVDGLQEDDDDDDDND
jgi:hypothetical protein